MSRKGAVTMYEFRRVHGHIEVFLDGEFQFSADTIGEAYKELEQEQGGCHEQS